jgi:hypothetical protein
MTIHELIITVVVCVIVLLQLYIFNQNRKNINSLGSFFPSDFETSHTQSTPIASDEEPDNSTYDYVLKKENLASESISEIGSDVVFDVLSSQDNELVHVRNPETNRTRRIGVEKLDWYIARGWEVIK